jgi:hypothetical protein
MYMTRIFVWAAFVLIQFISINGALAADTPANAPTTQYWHPDKFVISYWCGPPKKFVTLDRFKQIADAGFTIAFPPCGPTDVETNHKILDYCQQVGIKAFIQDPRMSIGALDAAAKAKYDAIIAEYSSDPALAGYFLVDEPGGDAFHVMGDLVSYFRQKDPKHPVFINMLPNYAPSWVYGGAPSYDTFIENFATFTHPDILCYDHYHFHKSFDAPGFFANLETFHRISMQSNIPFWNTVLLINHVDYRSPNENELKWEAMQSLAYGAKGVVYFTYWQPDKSDMWGGGEAIIDFDGNPTKKYEQMKRVNQNTQAIGKYLLNATSLRSYQFGQGGDETNAGDFPIRFEGPNITVGLFQDRGTHYVLFANRDYKNETTKDVFLKTGGKPLKKLDKQNDQWNDDGTESSGETKVTLHIAAGDGDLYRW